MGVRGWRLGNLAHAGRADAPSRRERAMKRGTDPTPKGRTATVTISGVPISNPDKVLYPETGFTKADVVGYYMAVSPFILPHLKDRPITMKRFPDGVGGPSFYEK